MSVDERIQIHAKVQKSLRVQIPIYLAKKYGIKPGDVVVICINHKKS